MEHRVETDGRCCERYSFCTETYNSGGQLVGASMRWPFLSSGSKSAWEMPG